MIVRIKNKFEKYCKKLISNNQLKCALINRFEEKCYKRKTSYVKYSYVTQYTVSVTVTLKAIKLNQKVTF